MSELNHEAQTILEAFRNDIPSVADFERIQASLEAQLALPTSDASTSTSASSAMTGVGIKLGFGAAGLVGLVTVLALSQHQQAPSDTPSITPTPTLSVETPPEIPEPSVIAAPSSQEVIAPQMPTVRIPTRPPRQRSQETPITQTQIPEAAPESTPPPEPQVPPSLTEELTLLQTAREALARGEPARALSLLELYSPRFGEGQLHEEYRATRAISLCQLGQRQNGLDELEHIQGTVYRETVRAACHEQNK